MSFRFLIIFFLFQKFTYAQIEDAWVYFNDKPNYEYFIENPLLILSQKSIEKKVFKNISIDFSINLANKPLSLFLLIMI